MLVHVISAEILCLLEQNDQEHHSNRVSVLSTGLSNMRIFSDAYQLTKHSSSVVSALGSGDRA